MKFYDLRINPEKLDEDNVESFLDTLKRLGFHGVSIYNPNNRHGELLKLFKKKSEEREIDYVRRLDIIPKTKGELNKWLAKNRYKFEIIAVNPKNLEVARRAAEDERVDIIYFDDFEGLFDYIQARIMSRKEKVLEICVKKLLSSVHRPPALYKYYKILSIAGMYKLKIVAVSGATTLYDLRSPRDLCSTLNILGHKDDNYSCVRKIPSEIIEENRFKLSKTFVLPGVIIEGKEDTKEIPSLQDNWPLLDKGKNRKNT